jgi:hypothetical protein
MVYPFDSATTTPMISQSRVPNETPFVTAAPFSPRVFAPNGLRVSPVVSTDATRPSLSGTTPTTRRGENLRPAAGGGAKHRLGEARQADRVQLQQRRRVGEHVPEVWGPARQVVHPTRLSPRRLVVEDPHPGPLGTLAHSRGIRCWVGPLGEPPSSPSSAPRVVSPANTRQRAAAGSSPGAG